MPEGASHATCGLCPADSTGRECAQVTDTAVVEDKVFTEAQHISLLESAVARETATLSTTNEELSTKIETLTTDKAAADTALTDAQAKIDVLEAEKSAAVQAKEEADKAFEDYKTELTELAAVETRRTERADAVKAAAPGLEESYFTDERIQRWAEMSQEQFDTLTADLKEAAADRKPEGEVDTSTEAARETAAFKGGKEPADAGVSTFGSLMGAVGFGPRKSTS